MSRTRLMSLRLSVRCTRLSRYVADRATAGDTETQALAPLRAERCVRMLRQDTTSVSASIVSSSTLT
jgi:hypothetical protein